MSSAGPLVDALSRHLSGAVQEMCIPAHVSESLEIWSAQQCVQFGQGVTVAIASGHPSPFLQISGESTPLPRFPFQNVPPTEERPSVSSAGGPSPMQVSHPFVSIPDVTEGVQCANPAPQSSNHTLLNFPEGGPVRLTRFVEIPLDSYYARVQEMIQAGRFEHIGRASIRLEGRSAWGVWLRIDQWSTALGRRPRLRCGVLYHLANRTLSFHGIATDAVRFLLPLFEDWTFPAIHQLPSVRVSQHGQDPQRRSTGEPQTRTLDPAGQNVPRPCPVRRHAEPPQDDNVFRTMMRQLIDVCHANQRHLACLREEIVDLRSQVSVLVARAPQAQQGAQSLSGVPPPPS